jgi:hypothetical protein
MTFTSMGELCRLCLLMVLRGSGSYGDANDVYVMAVKLEKKNALSV